MDISIDLSIIRIHFIIASEPVFSLEWTVNDQLLKSQLARPEQRQAYGNSVNINLAVEERVFIATEGSDGHRNTDKYTS